MLILFQPNFSNFVETMLGMPVEKWDQHWAPIHRLCPPCAGFHAVARMETFSDDSQYIIQMAGLSHILEVPWRNEKRKSARSTFQLQLSYYRQLTPPQLERLVEVYRCNHLIHPPQKIILSHFIGWTLRLMATTLVHFSGWQINL